MQLHKTCFNLSVFAMLQPRKYSKRKHSSSLHVMILATMPPTPCGVVCYHGEKNCNQVHMTKLDKNLLCKPYGLDHHDVMVRRVLIGTRIQFSPCPLLYLRKLTLPDPFLCVLFFGWVGIVFYVMSNCNYLTQTDRQIDQKDKGDRYRRFFVRCISFISGFALCLLHFK